MRLKMQRSSVAASVPGCLVAGTLENFGRGHPFLLASTEHSVSTCKVALQYFYCLMLSPTLPLSASICNVKQDVQGLCYHFLPSGRPGPPPALFRDVKRQTCGFRTMRSGMLGLSTQTPGHAHQPVTAGSATAQLIPNPPGTCCGCGFALSLTIYKPSSEASGAYRSVLHGIGREHCHQRHVATLRESPELFLPHSFWCAKAQGWRLNLRVDRYGCSTSLGKVS